MSGLSQGWYDFAQAFNGRAEKIHIWARDKGFWPERTAVGKLDLVPLDAVTNPYIIPTKLALIHSEISEALEADRTSAMDDKLPTRSGLEVELADAVIRIMDLAAAYGIDLGGAIAEKMAYNENRPYKHGKEY